MQHQILRVNDIEKAIQENGIEYYIDRLLQDSVGDYWWVDTGHEMQDGWKSIEIGVEPSLSGMDELTEVSVVVYYNILKIPQKVAWFCIDAIKLRSQVTSLGSGEYGDGQHGGTEKFYVIENDQCREVKKDVVIAENL